MADISDWPPGFRFHPTDEELVLYYLKRKISNRKIKLAVIAELDVYKFEPEELPGLSLLKNGDRQWFYFSPRDRKYPNGLRANRATRQGYWKTTGKDRCIACNSRNVGIKRTLVFYGGRAPSGQRTDWVMHEYILDEEELKRCQNVHDYYVIYKLFKKSGPGPKNGEQYGAPFKEEEWADDDCPKTTISCDQSNASLHVVNVPAIDTCTNTHVDHLVNDGELLSVVPSEPAPSTENFDEFEQALSEFLGLEETHNALANPSFEEPNRLVLEGDFIEMDDLLGPSPAQGLSTMLPQLIGGNIPQDRLLVEDGLGEFDLYHDPQSILYGLEPNDQRVPATDSHRSQKSESLNQSDLEVLSYHTFQEVGSQNLVGFGGHSYTRLLQEGQSVEQVDFRMHSYVRTHEGRLADKVDFPVQSYSDAISSVGCDMWTSDANPCVVNSTETQMRLAPLASTGVLNGGIYTSISSEMNQNEEVERSQTWSSNLWSFVDSIPAHPASAAESALLNKAFQRISSFGRVKLSSRSSAISSSVGSSNKKFLSAGLGGRIKGYLFFSFLAALVAVVYVCIEGINGVFGKLHCRMNS